MRSMSTSTSTAIRCRRYRARQRDGIQIVPVEVSDGYLDALIESGLHKEADRRDRDKIAATIDFLLDAYAVGAVKIDYDVLDEVWEPEDISR